MERNGGAYISFTDTYAVTFIIVSFYKYITAVKNKDYFISGLSAGIAFGFRISAVFGITAILISILHKNFTHAVKFIIGVISSVLVLASLLSFAGLHLQDFLTYGFIDNFRPRQPN